MTKPKNKPTLKEEFFKLAMTEIVISYPATWDKIWEFFEPHLKKSPAKIKIEIPQDKIKEFNQLWPEFKLPTGKYGRSSMAELNSAFQFFFKTFPEYTNWDIITEAAKIYLSEREADKWAFTRRSKYFIRREASDKSWESELSEYYQRINDGVQEIMNPGEEGFEPRIVT